MRIKFKLLLLILAISSTVGVTGIMAPKKAHALSGSEFQAGRIIDDGIFFSSSSMNTPDIQNFMTAKVPICDTNGTQPYAGTTRAAYGTSKGYPPPYKCLKDYRQDTTSKPADIYCNGFTAGNKSSAQIIYEVAQSCGISPKVILVLLQKEQTLVTDDWPWAIQYRSAAGYGCPDTAACDSQYYGFFNQVYAAARAYKYYAANPTQFNYRAGRDNFILYNPNSACGGSTIFIQNQATAGLYIYTPYQPNTAALSNLYGTGDGCSAYGNRNFWRMYRDWFGFTTGNGYEFVDAINPPPQINPNDVVTAQIRIRNRSGSTWYSDGNVPQGQHAFRLATFGYENTPFGNPSDPAWLGTSNQIRMVEASVADGDIATFRFTFRAPLQLINNYWTRFTPVYDGANFLPYIGLSFTTFTPSPIYSYKVTGSSGITNAMPTNYTVPVSYTIQNTGNIVWFNDNSKPAGTFALRMLTTNPYYHSSVFYDPNSWLATNQISMIDGRVSPGNSTIFSFNIKTPSVNGIYAEQFGLVLDGATAYPDSSQMSFSANVSDYRFTVVSNNIPSSLIAGQKYSGKITLRNTGAATWYADGNTPTNTHAIRLMTPGYVSHPFADKTDTDWAGSFNQVKMTTPSAAPGQTADFNFDFIIPYDMRTYNSRFQLVLDGVYIIPDLIQANTSVAAISPSFTQQPGGIHPSLEPLAKGQISTGKLIIRNTSNFVWYSDDVRPTQLRGGAVRVVMSSPYYRSSPFGSSDTYWLGTVNQIKMTTPIVNPGENAVFDFTWKAPMQSGTYYERFTLALDGYALFPDIGMQLVTTVR